MIGSPSSSNSSSDRSLSSPSGQPQLATEGLPDDWTMQVFTFNQRFLKRFIQELFVHCRLLLMVGYFLLIMPTKRRHGLTQGNVILSCSLKIIFNNVESTCRTGRPSALPSQTNVPNRRHEDDLGPLPEGNLFC